MDYFGEPAGTGTSSWPVVSSDFGQFDISGFPKPHAWWYVVFVVSEREVRDYQSITHTQSNTGTLQIGSRDST